MDSYIYENIWENFGLYHEDEREYARIFAKVIEGLKLRQI